jgi:hypothetical protein
MWIMVAGPHRSGAAALASRCDACPRIGGPSEGADDEAGRFVATGRRPLFRDFGDVPRAARP